MLQDGSKQLCIQLSAKRLEFMAEWLTCWTVNLSRGLGPIPGLCRVRDFFQFFWVNTCAKFLLFVHKRHHLYLFNDTGQLGLLTIPNDSRAKIPNNIFRCMCVWTMSPKLIALCVKPRWQTRPVFVKPALEAEAVYWRCCYSQLRETVPSWVTTCSEKRGFLILSQYFDFWQFQACCSFFSLNQFKLRVTDSNYVSNTEAGICWSWSSHTLKIQCPPLKKKKA